MVGKAIKHNTTEIGTKPLKHILLLGNPADCLYGKEMCIITLNVAYTLNLTCRYSLSMK